MRYRLQNSDDSGKTWYNTQITAKTKSEIEKWLKDNLGNCEKS